MMMAAALIGVGATVVVDLWALFLKLAFKIPSLSFCLVGRWFLHMPEGKFMHQKISAAQPKRLECSIGWIAHYAIGIIFGLTFILVAPGGWLAIPTVPPALLFGLATVLFPYFIMQPAFGLGVAASNTPSPAGARLKTLATHLVFGIGLFVCAWALRQLGSQ